MFKGKLRFLPFRRTFLAIVFLAFAGPARADTRMHGGQSVLIQTFPAPVQFQQCLPSNVTICNQVVTAPGGAVGAVATLAVPSPYVHQTFTVICTNSGYQVLDVTGVTCTPLMCSPSSVGLCGVAIPVPDTIAIGNSTSVPVPAAVLADPSTASPDLAFTARCVDDGNGGAIYKPVDTTHISCNLFPCADATVQVCGMALSVRGGTPMGGVQTLSMPPPFAPDPFTVQCVGSEGNPPVYQLTDASAVTCKLRPESQ